jgi:HEAT repeat protein
MTSTDPKQQLIRLASDNTTIYQDAWQYFLRQGASTADALTRGLKDNLLGSVAHWRILLILRELALPSTFPAVLASLQDALVHKDLIVLPGAIEAVAAFPAADAVSALEAVLRTADVDDVIHAIAVMGSIGGETTIAPLRALLERQETNLRKAIVRALIEMNTPAARDVLKVHRERENDPEIRAMIGDS